MLTTRSDMTGGCVRYMVTIEFRVIVTNLQDKPTEKMAGVPELLDVGDSASHDWIEKTTATLRLESAWKMVVRR